MDSKHFEEKIKIFQRDFEVKIIGKSFFGKNIYSVNRQFDKKIKWVLITGGIHAREHLSCDLLCLFISKLKEIEKLNFNLSFVPLINPDGADLCISGPDFLSDKERQKLIKINNSSEDFSLFKANGRGVDLNNNFDANFNKKFSNKTRPAPQGYYGKYPFSESETRAIRDWTKNINPFLTLSYHLKGGEIYFDFFQDKNRYERDFLIAQIFAKSTGYKIKSTQKFSSGGYKDWCVNKLKIPALTIEVGEDEFSHPYPASELNNIYVKNKNIFNDIDDALKIFESFK